jgi:cystathionine beta-synthase
MEPPLPAIELGETVETMFTSNSPAVVVAEEGKPVGVLTRADLLEFLAHGGAG